ncbi:MAG: hypothetical protein ACRD0K_14970 [Egibacteraceae bacterium]
MTRESEVVTDPAGNVAGALRLVPLREGTVRCLHDGDAGEL